MNSRTIKISEKTYSWLLSVATELQHKRGEKVSFDEAINNLKRKGEKTDIMKFAGAWKMSDKEWDETSARINKGWKKWKIPSA